MTNPEESAQQKPSSSEQQPQGKNSPPERTGQNESNVNQSEKSSDEGDNVKTSQGGDDQEGSEQNRTNVTETEGSGGDNLKGEGTPGDLENEKNVTQTDHGLEESSGGATSSNPGRKRGRQGGPVDFGSSSGSKAKKKGELDVPSGAPTCYVCKKGFASWKAVFGHLRAHRRQTPGAFPPPIFTPERSPERNNGDKALREQLAPTLLNLARETMQKMNEDSNASTAAAGEVGTSLRRGLDIDLNEPRTSVLLDQNDPPPSEKDDDDDDDKN